MYIRKIQLGLIFHSTCNTYYMQNMRKTMRFTIMSYGDESMSYHCKKYASNILLCPSTLSSTLEHK